MEEDHQTVNGQGRGSNRRIRIALVAPEVFPLPPREGFSTAIEFLIHEMSQVLKLDHDVTIYSIGDPAYADGRADGVDYRYTSATTFDRKIIPLLYRVARRASRKDLQYWQSTAYYLPYAIRMARKIRRDGADVVHLFTILQFAPWIRRLVPQAKIVFHLAWHGLSKEEPYYGYQVLRTRLADRCLKDVDAVVGCSDYLVDGIRQRFPDHAHKLHRVYNGVKLNSSATATSSPPHVSGSSSEEPAVIFAGRIVPEKGLHTLLKAMRIVLHRMPRARLQVVGVSWRPGSEFSGYERELQQLAQGIESRIEFLGWKSRAEFPKALAKADVFAFPSIWEEPFSMVLMEAMAVGLPVVATSSGGTPELIRDGETGFLVPPDDHVALADRILTLLSDFELRRQLGERGCRLIREDFSWERIVDELLKVYYQVLDITFYSAAAHKAAAEPGGA